MILGVAVPLGICSKITLLKVPPNCCQDKGCVYTVLFCFERQFRQTELFTLLYIIANTEYGLYKTAGVGLL